MGDQNRQTFKYRIRRGGHNQSDPERIKRLADLGYEKRGFAVGPITEVLHASTEDIETYRRQRQMGGR